MNSLHIISFQLIIWKKKNEDLAEVIPQEFLPNEYGGTAGGSSESRGFYEILPS